MKSASLLTSVGSLTNSSINRSPYAYEQNPDKDKYMCNVCIVCVHLCEQSNIVSIIIAIVMMLTLTTPCSY